MSFDARVHPAAGAAFTAHPTQLSIARLAPEVLGKVGEAFATSLWALHQRLSALDPGVEQRAALDAALASVTRLERLGVQVQAIARVLGGEGAAAPESIELNGALRQVIGGWAQAAQRRGVRLTGPAARAEPIPVEVCAGVLEQLLELLVDHATRLGDTVEIDASMRGQPACPMVCAHVQRASDVGPDGLDEVHWLLFGVLARALGLAPHRVAAGRSVTLMLAFPGRGEDADAGLRSAPLLPRTPIAAGRQVLIVEPREVPRLLAWRVLSDAGLQVDAAVSIAQARAALRERTPDILVTGLPADRDECGALVDELRVAQPRLRVIELVDDDSAFALSLPGSGQAGRVGRSELARTLVAAVSQELDAAWAGLAGPG